MHKAACFRRDASLGDAHGVAIRVTLPRDYAKEDREEADDLGFCQEIFFRNLLQERARTDSSRNDTAVIFSRSLRAIINPYD